MAGDRGVEPDLGFIQAEAVFAGAGLLFSTGQRSPAARISRVRVSGWPSGTKQYATDIMFLAIIFVGYSAVAYSRFRIAALLSVPLAGVIVAAAFWAATPATSAGSAIPGQALAIPQPPGFTVAYPWRLPGLLVAASLVLIAVVANAMQAKDRIRLMRAEHEEPGRPQPPAVDGSGHHRPGMRYLAWPRYSCGTDR